MGNLKLSCLKSGLVPVCPIIESPWGCVEQHDGYQGVQHHGEHQGDQVEEGDIHFGTLNQQK